VGPNGSGKTTLIECIAGIRRVESGRIEFNRVDVTRLAPEERHVGYLPQDCLLFPHLTVDDNIAFGQRESGAKAKEQVRGMMGWLGISHLAGRHIKGLSGGERQKVALARALIARPRVLLLDEPFSTLDRVSRTRLLGELRKSLDEVTRTLGLTSVFVTHDLAEAQLMSGLVAIMNDGHVEQVGTWNRVLEAPGSAFVADFMGFNILRGTLTVIEDSFASAEVKGQSIRGVANGLTVGDHVIAVFRPQVVSLSLERNIRKPGWRQCQCNVFEGRVTGMRKMGPVAQISMDVGFPLDIETSSDLVDELNIAVGRNAFAQFRASEVSFLHA